MATPMPSGRLPVVELLRAVRRGLPGTGKRVGLAPVRIVREKGARV